jgi:hypothetical protein
MEMVGPIPVREEPPLEWAWTRRRQFAGMAVGAWLVVFGTLAAFLEAMLVLWIQWEWGAGRGALETAAAFLPSLGVIWLVLSRPGRNERVGLGMACLLAVNLRTLLILAQIVFSGLATLEWSLFWIFLLDLPWIPDSFLEHSSHFAQAALGWADLGLIMATWFYAWHFAWQERLRALRFLATTYLLVAGLAQMILILGASVFVLHDLDPGGILPQLHDEFLQAGNLAAEIARDALTLIFWLVMAGVAMYQHKEIRRAAATAKTE